MSISSHEQHRYKQLMKDDWKVIRHMEEKLTGVQTTMSDEDFEKMSKERMLLRKDDTLKDKIGSRENISIAEIPKQGKLDGM